MIVVRGELKKGSVLIPKKYHEIWGAERRGWGSFKKLYIFTVWVYKEKSQIFELCENFEVT